MEKGNVYLAPLVDMSACKIGRAIVTEDRLFTLSKDYSFDFENSYILECAIEDMKPLEGLLHKNFHRYNIKGMPKLDGYTEFFEIECLEKALQFVKYIDFNVKIKKGVLKKHYESCSQKSLEDNKSHKLTLEELNLFCSFLESNKYKIIDLLQIDRGWFSDFFKIYMFKDSVSTDILKDFNFLNVEFLDENVVLVIQLGVDVNYGGITCCGDIERELYHYLRRLVKSFGRVIQDY